MAMTQQAPVAGRREFTVADAYEYDYRSPMRWILSHIMRYAWLPVLALVGTTLSNILYSQAFVLVGEGFNIVAESGLAAASIRNLALQVMAVFVGVGVFGMLGAFAFEILAQRAERDAREELYISLLGKSQTFHNRQRVGDIMARATNDVKQFNLMINPGLGLIFESLSSTIAPIIFIGLLRPELLLVPVLFLITFGLVLWHYTRELAPVAGALRGQFGTMNAGLAESVAGIEVVKAYAQEVREKRRFVDAARRYRDLFVEQGYIQARYLPLLAYGIAYGLALAHALFLFQQGVINIGEVVAFMGLMNILRFPTFISIFSFVLVQLGFAGSERVLELIKMETEMDENADGLARTVEGAIEFEHVSFSFAGEPVLKDISFYANPGETIAIVGQTGSGKTTLTRLVNRTYDVTEGRVLIDGSDVREWSMQSLRSQISTIEQDIFLFSRTIGENIAFGCPGEATREQIEQAAREAQAHDFIMSFPDGYDTVVGERGVTLSGGQRQRIAIARAFLTNPRILVLDDSTSAIDSATEDQIQRAIRRILQGRTTLLITHRISQIRWADRILVLRQGALVAQGTHEELIEQSEAYRRIFARYS